MIRAASVHEQQWQPAPDLPVAETDAVTSAETARIVHPPILIGPST
jgi:hypothetical protein